ncbi:MAG: hypothetical protein H7070_07120 [Saprospiraceae bacterium]|nr:hypothetical protein [Pyrinomonadaceae bacterium]
MNSFQENSCPKCHYAKMKTWDELTAEQQMLAERLPGSAEYTQTERKKHRFCERCWFEDKEFEGMLT